LTDPVVVLNVLVRPTTLWLDAASVPLCTDFDLRAETGVVGPAVTREDVGFTVGISQTCDSAHSRPTPVRECGVVCEDEWLPAALATLRALGASGGLRSKLVDECGVCVTDSGVSFVRVASCEAQRELLEFGKKLG
jgi:hypothetical protein